LVPDWDYFVGWHYARKWGSWPKTYEYETWNGKIRMHLADQGDARPMDHWSNRDLFTKSLIIGGVVRRPVGQVIKEWEEMSGQKWPIDTVTGRPYIADHVVPFADGGLDHGSNLRPLENRQEHIEQHMKNGDFSRWAKLRKWQKKIKDFADHDDDHH
jgi:hypothetical protein